MPPCPTCFGRGEVEPELEAPDDALGSPGASSPRFTYADKVRVRTDVAHQRAGQELEVVAITVVESDVLAAHYRVAVGTTVHEVDFSDGSSAEFPAAGLDRAE